MLSYAIKWWNFQKALFDERHEEAEFSKASNFFNQRLHISCKDVGMWRLHKMRGQIELSGRIDFKRNTAYSVGGPLRLGQSKISTYTRSGIAMFKLGCQG